jgi:hypothetical protein
MTRKDQSPATLETIASQLEKLSKDVGFLDRSIKTLAGRIEAYEGERGSKRSGPYAKTTLPPALLAAALNVNIRNRLTRWRNAAFPGHRDYGLSAPSLVRFPPGHLHFYEQWRFRRGCGPWNNPDHR